MQNLGTSRNEKGIKMSDDWTDLYKDGRRLNRIIRQMETRLKNETNDDVILALIDRIIKCTHEKTQITHVVLGVKEILKESKNRLN